MLLLYIIIIIIIDCIYLMHIKKYIFLATVDWYMATFAFESIISFISDSGTQQHSKITFLVG